MPIDLDRLKAALADRYAIDCEIGRGGTAVVYLAEDLKHRRRVAIKVLRPDVVETLGAERFLREIDTASQLHHPHVLPLYNSGEAEGFLYYVMPYVGGETLRERLEREKQLSIEEASRIAVEVADGLGYAHRMGLVHRDIKPSNILLSEGHALIADFGIAKAVAETAADGLTETRVSVGSPTYMSPEQASGEGQVDARSDIYSLGCVLYEMLAGEPPFTGPSGQAITARKMLDPVPRLRTVRDRVPEALERVVGKALAKQPVDRFDSGSEFKQALDEIATKPDSRSRAVGVRWLWGGITAAATIVAALLILNPPRGPDRVTLPEPKQATFVGNVLMSTLSPDGQWIAFVVEDDRGQHLMVQEIDGGAAIEKYSDSFLGVPSWSPDGSQIVFGSNEGTSLIPRSGTAEPRRVLALVLAEWSPDGSRLVSWTAQAQEIWFTDVETGDTTRSVSLGSAHTWVLGIDWSPGGDRLVFATEGETYGLSTMRPDGTGLQRVLEDSVWIGSPRWSHDGSGIYYLRGRDPTEVWWIEVTSDGRARGAASLVQSGIPVFVMSGIVPAMSLSRDGDRMAYVHSVSSSNLWSFQLDGARPGDTLPGLELTTGTAERNTPRIAPDGSRIAFVKRGARGSNLFVMPLEGGRANQLTFAEADVWSPVWSPDARRIAFGWTRSDEKVWVVDAAAGAARSLDEVISEKGNHFAWAPASKIVAQTPGDRDFQLLEPDGAVGPTLLGAEAAGWIYDPRASPDGGRLAVYWNRPPDSGLWILDSRSGAARFVGERMVPIGWSEDGEYIYSMGPGEDSSSRVRDIYRVPISGGERELLGSLPVAVRPWNVSLTADGRQLVAAVEESRRDVVVLENLRRATD